MVVNKPPLSTKRISTSKCDIDIGDQPFTLPRFNDVGNA
jgi:hypothetical protein